MLKTDDFVPKIGVDTAENELRKEWRVVKTLWLSAEQGTPEGDQGHSRTNSFSLVKVRNVIRDFEGDFDI